MVYWADENPLHHHQNLSRPRRAFSRPDTIVVHEPFWTPTARHADIVIPSTISLERDDIGAAFTDHTIVAMKQAVSPYAESRNDYERFSDLASALGVEQTFTEGRHSAEWLEHLYESWRLSLVSTASDIPPFAEYWERVRVELNHVDRDLVAFEAVRGDPIGSPLATPSGKIEIHSETIEGFDYHDCPGHPVWLEPKQWLGGSIAKRYPLQLVANNPVTRLHGQLDPGEHSQASTIQGREPARIHQDDAAARGISERDVDRLFKDRGSCLAGARIDPACLARGRPALNRRLVRSARSRSPRFSVRSWNPECVDVRRGELEPRAGMLWAALAG